MSFSALQKCRIFSGNALKILAAVLMAIDHIGAIFYPTSHFILRKIGRLSFPVFAFFIAEGCRYTKNKAKHFSVLAGLAIVCEIVVRIAVPSNQMASVLVTFSLSVLLIYALQAFKKALFENDKAWKTALFGAAFLGGIALCYLLCSYTELDYGFWGVMTPVFASLLDVRSIPAPSLLQKADCLPARVLCIVPCLFLLVETSYFPALQWYAFLAIPFLLLYNGQKGKWKMKYFFYIFYPAHLALLYGIFYFFFQ